MGAFNPTCQLPRKRPPTYPLRGRFHRSGFPTGDIYTTLSSACNPTLRITTSSRALTVLTNRSIWSEKEAISVEPGLGRAESHHPARAAGYSQSPKPCPDYRQADRHPKRQSKDLER